MGIPLLAGDGSVLGHLAVLDTKPLDLGQQIESVLRLFAARAEAELRQLHAESAVRESEQRFSRLFDSTMDGIVELNNISLSNARISPPLRSST